ncbi:winged helix-turn-helix domain-containing protein [Haladaptatus cibarius]|uniref:winged helix-turn-helix domain-containing protein n=1 Tax=Haladaptatus cibarius TaxID=453847 RepID=UPI0006784D6E|nr:winged helix-turn-helix domain-containing protein [Haladaptatus cibarius]
MSGEPSPAELFRLLDDEYARAILTKTSERPMSAQTLSTECDASLPTIYRRLNDLEACNLIEKFTRPEPDGNHRSMYESTVGHVEIDIEEGVLDVEMTKREDVADRFTRVWSDMRGD